MAFPLILKAGSFLSGGFFKWVMPLLTAAPIFLKKSIKSKELKKYLPYVVAAGIALFIWYILRIEKLKIDADDVSGNDDEGRANKLALLILEHLGTSKTHKWWQVSTWTEDEDEVLKILEENKDIKNLIISAYNRWSKSGNFILDIQGTFNSEQLQKFNEIF